MGAPLKAPCPTVSKPLENSYCFPLDRSNRLNLYGLSMVIHIDLFFHAQLGAAQVTTNCCTGFNHAKVAPRAKGRRRSLAILSVLLIYSMCGAE